MAHEKILIVDDEQSMVQFLSVLLKREGYDVRVAQSGAKALELLREDTADVVMTDLKMPGMDGVELLEKIMPAGQAWCAGAGSIWLRQRPRDASASGRGK